MPSVPTARPPGGGGGPIYGLVFLAVLLAGDYYVLSNPSSAKATQPTTTQVVATTKKTDQLPTPASAKATNKGQKKKGYRKVKTSAPSQVVTSSAPPTTAVAPTTAPGQGFDIFGSLGGGSSASSGSSVSGYADKAVAWGESIEEMHIGLLLRFLLVIVSGVLIFVQNPPPHRAGTQWRVAKKKSEIIFPVQVMSLVLFFSGLLLMGMGIASDGLLVYGYPISAAIVVGCGFIAGQLVASTKLDPTRLAAEKVRIDTDNSIVLPARGGQFVNIPNPDRGILVFGGAGAGKTYSIGEPCLEQFLLRGRCGLIYDFKFPVLGGAAQKALLYSQEAHERLHQDYLDNKKANRYGKHGIIEGLRKPIRHRVVNFLDMQRTEKVNPLRPADMTEMAYAIEYAKTILSNLRAGGPKSGDSFFDDSAEAFLTGIIWFYRNNYPALCTIPHVVATALYGSFTHVLSLLASDPDSRVLVQSIITAAEQKSEKQLAGIVSSLQIALVRLTTPKISWVLAPDERAGEGFSLNLNDPDNPTLLTIGNDPTLATTFGPVISCIVAVSLKLMNQQFKHPSFVLIDEGATLYVPGLETIPATARSNRVCLLYMTQDKAQMVDKYGKDKTEVLISNLNNQLFGKVNNLETARLMSDMVGKEEVETVSVSASKSMGGGKSGGGRNLSQSVSVQERYVIRPQDMITQELGEFIGQTVETNQPFFQALIDRDVEPGKFPIEPISRFEDAEGVVTPRIIEHLKRARQKTEKEVEQLRVARQHQEDEFSREQDQRRALERQALRQRLLDAGDPTAERLASQPKVIKTSPPPAAAPKPVEPVQVQAPVPALAIPAPSAQLVAHQESEARKKDAEARLVRSEKVIPLDPMERLIQANHEAIYEEVRYVINSVPNHLDPKAGAQDQSPVTARY
jgi:hypothetical protein